MQSRIRHSAGLGERIGAGKSGGSWSSYWATRGLTSYIQRLQDEDGIIDNNKTLGDAVQDAIDAGIINKIDFWINSDFGKINPLTVPLSGSVLFTFDDCIAVTYDQLYPALKTRSVKGTMFVATDYIKVVRTDPGTGYGFRMNIAEVVSCQDVWDLQSHSSTHPSYATNSKAIMDVQEDAVDTWFTANGIPIPKHMAYPGGAQNFAVWKNTSKKGRIIKRLTSEGHHMQYAALKQDLLRCDLDFSDLATSNRGKAQIDDAIALKQAVAWISHDVTAAALAWYLVVVDYAIAQGIDILTISQFYTKMNKIRGKYFSIKNDLWLNNLFEYSPVVNKRIFFNDTLANITATIANAYVADGYEVGFLDDTADAAQAYVVPNTSFRTQIRIAKAVSGQLMFSIGSGALIGVGTDNYLQTFTNGYSVRFITTRRLYVQKWVAGTSSLVKDYTLISGPTDWEIAPFTVKFALNAGRVEVWINGSKVIDEAEATFANGNLLISTGTLTTKNYENLTITNFIDSGGLNDTFTDPAASALNYTAFDKNVREGEITFSSGRVVLRPGIDPLSTGCSLGLQRVGTFTYGQLTMQAEYPRINSLRKMIDYSPSFLAGNEYFDYNGLSISGTIQTCGIHLLKNAPEIRLYNNALTGTIPEEWKELQWLKIIRLDTNQISGYEQGAFTCKHYLTSINLDNNLLTTAAVNQILIDVRDNVKENKIACTLNIAGVFNATPTGDAGDPATGLGALYQLQNSITELGANADCTVTYNAVAIDWVAQYKTMYYYLPTKPTLADAIIQNTWLKGMVDGGYYAKAELLDLFSTDVAANSLINWKSPGVFNPSLNSTPAFTAYAGYKGASGKYVKLNFVPSTNGTLIGQDNICAIIGVGDNVAEALNDFGATSGSYAKGLTILSRFASDGMYFRCNSAIADTNANTNSIGHYAMSRGAGANFDTYKNATKVNKARASTALCEYSLAACAYNSAGIYEACTKTIRYAFLFSYLTEAEVQGVITLTEAYLDNYATGLI